MTVQHEGNVLRTHVIIVGAGPIGLELAVSLKQAGVDYLHFDAGQIGQTFTWWPRDTRFFSTPERIAIAGYPIQTREQGRITGEEYLAYLRAVVEQAGLRVGTYEKVLRITPQEDGFAIETQHKEQLRRYQSDVVVLATGDMHQPRRLNIPGEDLPHVTHYFRDPHQYFQQRLLIVGGRNAALEAALRCFRIGARVTVSYRRRSFDAAYVKPHLLDDVKAQIEAGTIQFLPETQPVHIAPAFVELAQAGSERSDRLRYETDFVLLCTGYEADQHLMTGAGVAFTGPANVPVFNTATMETNVPGLYVAGTAAAGMQNRYVLFIENSHQHVGLIVKSLTGEWPAALGTIPERSYDLSFEAYKRN